MFAKGILVIKLWAIVVCSFIGLGFNYESLDILTVEMEPFK